MTAFTTVPDDVLEPGDPIRSIDIIALRDNPIAMFGGAAGAPRLVGNAVSLFPGTYPVLTVTASNDFSVNNGLGTTVAQTSTTSSTFVDVVTHIINKFTGSINFRAIVTYNGGDSNGTYEIRAQKNGATVQTFSRSFSSAPFDFSEGPVNISVVPGDNITWQLRRVSGTTVLLGRNGNNTASNGYIIADLFRPAV